jgi:hypothetical protein
MITSDVKDAAWPRQQSAIVFQRPDTAPGNGLPKSPDFDEYPGQRAAAPRHLPAAPEGERHGTIRS